jgi:diaminopropionate ammonia-lyase
VFLPERSAEARRAAIVGEGADVVVVDGTYEEAVARAAAEAEAPGVVELADVGGAGPPGWAVDGYATLFEEAAEQADFNLLVVPVGVGSLASAAARFAAGRGVPVVAAEPLTAACLSASIAAGSPQTVETPGSTMAGLDCAEVSPSAWPDLRAGISATIALEDEEAHTAMRELAGAGLVVGESGAAPLAALRVLAEDPDAAAVREAVRFGSTTRALLVATEGATDPVNYDKVVSG